MSHPFERSCPKCGAASREACLGKRGPRKSMHRERWLGFNFRPEPGVEDADTESPIETKLMQALRGWITYSGATGLVLRTQAKIGPYRADLLIEDRRGEAMRRLVIECDGLEFHSSDRAVDRDRRRDRWFAANHIFVMRFFGAEIHRDARGCAAQIGQWVEVHQ